MPLDSTGAVRTGGLGAIARLLRPHQWTKNAFVLAPLLFARVASQPRLLVAALEAALLFCLASSAVYVFNDVVDAPADREHPVKRTRPVASGQVPPFLALGLSALLAAASLAGAACLPRGFAAAVGAYLGVNLFYSLGARRVVLLDAMLIGVSFVLRVLGGAAAIDVSASHWVLLCTFLLALFLAFSKRRAELRLLDEDPGRHRPALRGYTPELLDRFDAILLAATVVCYALYTVAPETVAKVGSDRMIYGVPFVLFGLFRYLLLVESGGDAGEPGTLALRDGPMLLCVALWIAFSAWVLYAR
jgi:4-hydroxybenzoate polyprenyltransferase